jgi:acyl carrier protein
VALPTEADVLAEIQRIASEELEIATPIQSSDPLFSGLALDSMRLTILAVGLEDRFRIRLSHEDATQVTTVAELAQLVALRTQEASPC